MSPAATPVFAATPAARDPLAAVRAWLWLTIGLVFLMIVIGGATRLTGSGLSITEWRPVTGAVPPLNLADWMAEFERYRQSSQYELINKGMTLDEFKFIYWWEWGHRQLGRLIGAVYLVGFLWFAARRAVSARTTVLLFGMGVLLGLQGVIGWIMVASGLQPGMVAVAPVKLTLHLLFASLFLASLVAMVVAMTPPRRDETRAPGNLQRGAWTCLAALFLQIALGGLVAGSRAGVLYNTWPLMDGRFIPDPAVLFALPGLFANLTGNFLFIQFSHRMMAYFLLLLVALHAMSGAGFRAHPGFRNRAWAIVGLTLAQGVIGIVTLLFGVPLWAGLAHQAAAMIVLVMMVAHVARAGGWRVRAT